MTDVRAPQADPYGSPGPSPEGAGDGLSADRPIPPAPEFGTIDWLKWAWRQLTSMRIALVLLFLLALGSVPGSILPQEGSNPSGVQQYFTAHKALAPWLSRLGLFNVFGAPWFAAIYLLLFASLVGCVVPRTFRLAGSARTLPPRAPRHLTRLPKSATYPSALPPGQAIEVAARVLSARRFRLRRADGAAERSGGYWLSAEKGYLRECGNLLFHLALLGVLVSIALGGLFGYKADRLLVVGSTFSDTQTDLDEVYPGRLVSASDLPPFTITLNNFEASYITTGTQRGQPSAFAAQLSYTAQPGEASRSYRLEVNKPLSVDGAKVYLIGHGYAPVFKVTDSRGQVVYDQATPFVAGASGNFLSQGVVKVSGAEPEQLGFSGVFVPTAIDLDGTLQSVFPAAENPVVSLSAYAGNLDPTGAPQSVYYLDPSGLHELTSSPVILRAGQTLKLPHGQGSISFTGYQQWVSLTITHDPGQLPALICGLAALTGLLLSFMVRRRRLFVRAEADPDGSTGAGSTVQIGGLTRTDASGGFEEEFAALAAELRSAHDQATPELPAPDNSAPNQPKEE